MIYDNEEQNIIDTYEKGTIKLSAPSKQEIESIKMIAKNIFKKNRKISLRRYEHDYLGIQKKL